MKVKLDQIVLVDDDAISNYVTEELIRDKDLCENIVILTDGNQALGYLQNLLQQKPSAHPNVLVLLDLNMPVMDGFEFMEALESQQVQRQVVVAVLTSSDNHKDISHSQKYNIAAYLQKPVSPDIINNLIEKHFLVEG